jgi:peptidoglycan/LPS O-acetylase OafA/YrhL
MDVVRASIFLALALLTIVLAYLYQRNARLQPIKKIWVWPAIYFVLAVHAVWRVWAQLPDFWIWVAASFAVGIVIGVLRTLAFRVERTDVPGTMRLRPTLLSGAIYCAVLIFNEYEQVFHWGDANLVRISCSLLVLTFANSLAVNIGRALKWRMTSA